MNTTKVRGVLSSLLLLCFVVVSITGIGLGLAPPGRVAKEIGWTFLGMDKEMLELIHEKLGLLMIVLVVLHFIINYKMYRMEISSLFKFPKKKK